MRYRIVCRGTLRDGFDAETVQKNLASLFSLNGEQVSILFSGRTVIVKRGVGHDTAERYRAGLEQAGVVCEIEPETDASMAVHRHQASSGTPSGPGGVLIPEKMPGSLRFSPVNCPHLSERDGMLNTARTDSTAIPYDDLALATVWAEESPNGQAYRLLLFISGQQRPFQVEDSAIDFHSFPGVAATTALEGLRRLVSYLRDRNPGMSIDQPTASFLAGKLPLITGEFPLAHVTAIGTALIEHGVIRGE